jgi:hypothetical protein
MAEFASQLDNNLNQLLSMDKDLFSGFSRFVEPCFKCCTLSSAHHTELPSPIRQTQSLLFAGSRSRFRKFLLFWFMNNAF